MNLRLINQFQQELDRIRTSSGVTNEQVIRPAFREMLRAWAKSVDLILLEEHEFETKRGTKVYPDGTIVHDLRVPFGYWEAKDTSDDLDEEIARKTARGYPSTNIVYENSHTAVLIQNSSEIARCEMSDADALADLLARFFAYEREEIRDFRKAVRQFQDDLPAVLSALRERIATAYDENDGFRAAAAAFLDHAETTINPTLGEADVREMLIQHILTEEIFNHVFNEGDFHRENNVARQLYALEAKFFRGAVKKDTLRALEPYYAAIRTAAASITAHSEKQKFLKVIYEGFYKVYNPKAADRLGVVYTPNEIVRFMIDGADWLCREHFGRGLIDRDVDILDPCTGTGTYVCEMLETFRGDRAKLAHKYKHELHANEMAILPYYVANLNIEATYAAITGQYAEYPSLCFVDTLDNVAALGGKGQLEMFGAVSDENIARVKRQNAKKISIIIGNPPYNAGQLNELNDNKNRDYPHIDTAIRNTYIKNSNAQKTVAYDPYARFFRWATDRLDENGIISFITNRSFIEKSVFDGFRRCISESFCEIWIVDLGGDVRANPQLSGPRHNVFAIQTGVAITFLVKKPPKLLRNAKKLSSVRQAVIRYTRRPEMEEASDKLAFLASTSLVEMEMEEIKPSESGNWINQIENEWDDLIPIADKKTKLAKVKGQERAIFRDYATGIMSGRDEWVYAHSETDLKDKVEYLSNLGFYAPAFEDNSVTKTSRNLRRKAGSASLVRSEIIKDTYFRPFVKKRIYFSELFIDEPGGTNRFFGVANRGIAFLSVHSNNPLAVMASNLTVDYGLLKRGNGGTQFAPRYRYSKSGAKIDNITDWALNRFQEHYGEAEKDGITKDAIFHYCYAVLHDPVYRERYAINLKREFPRIPSYDDFHLWAGWGETLMALHIGYEEVEPWPLQRLDAEPSKNGATPKPILKSIPPEDIDDDSATGTIRIDADTTLSGVPAACWRYKLGNRTAIDWVLDQHKEKKPRDPTIREKFDTYRFADHKERVIDLLARVARVSVETVAITDAMAALERPDD
ncbi:type ISP restriction/modification enzyme [Notoacmeibacter marinus]|uniref:type ISP restriction/modification enzyme n=1 Tax=Notoacmeibacter marinus TaxID=1876515 RepID=UPI000DF3EA6B|nr:type ISP restriction/modification enzyme [Notoacmeibacter marinus]